MTWNPVTHAATLSGNYADVGTLDSHKATYTWTVTGGSGSATHADFIVTGGSFNDTIILTTSACYTITVTVTVKDDDTGTVSARRRRLASWLMPMRSGSSLRSRTANATSPSGATSSRSRSSLARCAARAGPTRRGRSTSATSPASRATRSPATKQSLRASATLTPTTRCVSRQLVHLQLHHEAARAGQGLHAPRSSRRSRRTDHPARDPQRQEVAKPSHHHRGRAKRPASVIPRTSTEGGRSDAPTRTCHPYRGQRPREHPESCDRQSSCASQGDRRGDCQMSFAVVRRGIALGLSLVLLVAATALADDLKADADSLAGISELGQPRWGPPRQHARRGRRLRAHVQELEPPDRRRDAGDRRDVARHPDGRERSSSRPASSWSPTRGRRTAASAPAARVRAP